MHPAIICYRQWRASPKLADYIADGEINLSEETVLEVHSLQIGLERASQAY